MLRQRFTPNGVERVAPGHGAFLPENPHNTATGPAAARSDEMYPAISWPYLATDSVASAAADHL